MHEISIFLVGVFIGFLVMFLVARNNKKKFMDALSMEADDVIDRIKEKLKW